MDHARLVQRRESGERTLRYLQPLKPVQLREPRLERSARRERGHHALSPVQRYSHDWHHVRVAGGLLQDQGFHKVARGWIFVDPRA